MARVCAESVERVKHVSCVVRGACGMHESKESKESKEHEESKESRRLEAVFCNVQKTFCFLFFVP